MVLTEPDAGSDVGAGRTKAIQQDDGSWHIEGVKRFITSAEHDMTDNIIHYVLARPEGAGPGTKGLSLFIVPKFDFDWNTGELGERNGAFVTNVEHKMGLKASTTCEVRFGETIPAKGWLLGEVHDGIAQMFKVIEHARMMVGTKAYSELSAGYLAALDYAKTRVQSADLTQAGDKTAPRVTIIHHPDVRRQLMTQKAYAEGLRAVALYTASVQDRIQLAEFAKAGAQATTCRPAGWPTARPPAAEGRGARLDRRAAERPAAADRQGRRLRAVLRAARPGAAGLRRLRLPAGLPAGAVHPRQQDRLAVRGHHRDPGPGLLLPQDRPGQGRRRSARCRARSRPSSTRSPTRAGSRSSARRSARALAEVGTMVGAMIGQLTSAQDDVRNVYKVGLNTTRLLMSCGDLAIGWLLLRQASVALDQLDGNGLSAADKAFYEGKLAVARFFATTVLPELVARRKVVESTDNAIMDVAEDVF